jgi:hypothetical protein
MNNKVIKLVAFNQFIGGVFGAPYLLYLAYTFYKNNPGFWSIVEVRHYFIIFYSLLMAFFVLSIISSLFLFKLKRIGLKLSRLVQILQLPTFIIGNYTYAMGLGLNLFVQTGFKKVLDKVQLSCNFSVNFPMKFNVSTLANTEGLTVIGLNIIALICCYILFISHYKNDVVK